jgi:hypothetical protein
MSDFEHALNTVAAGYVKPAHRPAAWTAMAAGLVNDGRSITQIAAALWVDEATVHQLLELAGRAQ